MHKNNVQSLGSAGLSELKTDIVAVLLSTRPCRNSLDSDTDMMELLSVPPGETVPSRGKPARGNKQSGHEWYLHNKGNYFKWRCNGQCLG